MFYAKICQRPDSNCGLLVSEATTLPTELQPPLPLLLSLSLSLSLSHPFLLLQHLSLTSSLFLNSFDISFLITLSFILNLIWFSPPTYVLPFFYFQTLSLSLSPRSIRMSLLRLSMSPWRLDYLSLFSISLSTNLSSNFKFKLSLLLISSYVSLTS